MPTFIREIEQMPQIEKLRMMDVLWTSILASADSLEPPAWHAEVLRERRRRAESGEETFVPWEEAKRRLRKEFA